MISAFVSSVSGGGATTLLLSVATRIASRGKRVVLIDADPLGELSQRFRARPACPLDDLFAWNEPHARQVRPTEVAPGIGLFPLDYGRFIGSGVALSPGVLNALARSQMDKADAVFIDLPPLGSPAAANALSVVDSVVACTPLNVAGVRALPHLLRLILSSRRVEGGPPRLAGLVGGQLRDDASALALDRELLRVCGSHAYVSVPFEQEIERATSEGGVADIGLSSALAPAVSRFATALVGAPARSPAPSSGVSSNIGARARMSSPSVRVSSTQTR